MKIEYNGIYTNVLRHCPLPCRKCAFFLTLICKNKPNFNYILCGSHRFEKYPGYIFKV